MATEKKINNQNELEKFSEALEKARQMQQEWMNYGLDFVELYVEDAEGDWLEKWREEEEEEVGVTNMNEKIEAIKEAIGIPNFNRRELLEITLTHRSYINEHPELIEQSPVGQGVKYKRLALLGDAILDAVVTDYLYRRYPNADKSTLSTHKNSLVDRKKLSEFAQELNLRKLCLLGGTAEEIDKSEQNRFLSETFEVLFAAIYLEFNRDFSRAGEWLINRFIAEDVDENYNVTQQQQAQEISSKRVFLGNEILKAIVIDYLYHRFPDRDQHKLTQWKSKLVDKKAFFTKEFKGVLGKVYLEFECDCSRTRDWLVEKYMAKAVDELLAEELHSEQFVNDSDPRDLQRLVSHITDKNKQEEFLRMANVLQPADELLLLMKQKINDLAAENERLQQLLIWVNHKSMSVSPLHKPAAVRAFYLALVRVLGLNFSRAFEDPNRDRAKARQFFLNLDSAFTIVNDHTFSHTLNLSLGDNPKGIIVCVLALDLESELKQALKQLREQLPHPDEEKEKFDRWRQDNGKVWVEKLRALIGYNWQFSDEQKELLNCYYYAHNLLVNCLNSDICEVAPTVREEIEETLLLPTDLLVDDSDD